MVNKKLSKLQKFILLEAYRRDGIQNADVLIRWYGFQPASHGKLKFNRGQIGIKRYLSATASTSKAITRLRDRGLVNRKGYGWGHALTPVGREVAQRLING